MLRNIAIGLGIAGYSWAQDDTTTPTVPDTDPRPSSVDLDTVPTVLPTLTLTDNIVTGSVSTQEGVTATGVACIPEGEQLFSIQTNTVVETGPLTVTPVCGQSVSASGTEMGSMTTQGIVITGGGGNASAITTATASNGTVMLTTSMSGMESGTTTLTATTSPTGGDESETTTAGGGGAGQASESSGAAATPTDSPAGRVTVGGVAGLLGLAAGVIVL